MSLLKTNEIQNYNGSSLTLTASTVSTSAQLNTGGNISVTGSLNVSDDSTTRTNLGLGTIATQDSNNVNLTGGTIGSGVVFPAGHIVQTKHAYANVYVSSVFTYEPVNLVALTTDTFNNSSNYLLIYCAGQFARGNGSEASYPVTLKLATGGTVSGLTVSGHTVYSTEGNILDNSGGSTVSGQYVAYSKIFKYQLSSTSALTFRVIADDGQSNVMESDNSIQIFEVMA